MNPAARAYPSHKRKRIAGQGLGTHMTSVQRSHVLRDDNIFRTALRANVIRFSTALGVMPSLLAMVLQLAPSSQCIRATSFDRGGNSSIASRIAVSS